MEPKVSITERLAGSIKLDDQNLIDEIIESEIWDYDEDLECMADWPSDSEELDYDGATTPRVCDKVERMCGRRSARGLGSRPEEVI